MATIFRIESGKFALTLVGDADDPTWQAPGGAGVDEVDVSDYTTASGVDFSCQVTSGALTAAPNTSQATTAATFCDPEVTTTNVGVTSYTLDTTFLQDPNGSPAGSASRYFFQYDTKLAYFFLGFDGVNPPKAIGKVRIVAGAIGGDARVDLTATLSLPVEKKPDIMFGSAGDSLVVLGGGDPATGATAGTPGTWTPAGSTPPASVTALIAASPAVTASPASAWTTGQYVQTGTGGTSGQAHWSGTAWVAAPALAAAKASAASATK